MTDFLADPHGLLSLMLFAILLVTTLGVIYIRDLLGSVLLFGIFSLIMALLYLVMEAPDVAITEAAVGAGISSIIFLTAIVFTGRNSIQARHRTWPAKLLVTLLGLCLLYATQDMPVYGDIEAPIHQHVAPYYLRETMAEIGIPNVVTAVLASYRGFDTLGEVSVVFTAMAAVLLLLWPQGSSNTAQTGANPAPADATPKGAMHDMLVLRIVSKLTIPFILLFGLYVLTHGEYSPGGGFQAGVIVAAGFLLYALIFGADTLLQKCGFPTLQKLAALGAMMFGGTGVIAVLRGGNFLEFSSLHVNPLTGQFLGIFTAEVGIGLTVCAVMMALYLRFATHQTDAGEHSIRQTEED